MSKYKYFIEINSDELILNLNFAIIPTEGIGYYIRLLHWSAQGNGLPDNLEALIRLANPHDTDLFIEVWNDYLEVLFYKTGDRLFPKGNKFVNRIYRRKNKHRQAIPKNIQRRVLAKGECEYCGSSAELQIDHIKPVSKGGGNHIENLQCLCRSCNRAKYFYTEEEYFQKLDDEQ